MNRGNCLIRTRVEDPFQAIVLIDYEFAGYGHRGQDIGKHFYMHAIDVTDIANNMKSGLEYPKFEERENFRIRTLATYMEALGGGIEVWAVVSGQRLRIV